MSENTPIEIVRPRLRFESQFTMVPNAWLRDKSIAGNGLTVLLYLLSQKNGYHISRRKLASDLGLGHSAYYSALNSLEEAGYLRRKRHRDARGREQPMAFILIDPFAEENVKESADRTDFQNGNQQSKPVDNTDFQNGKRSVTPVDNSSSHSTDFQNGKRSDPLNRADSTDFQNGTLKKTEIKNIKNHDPRETPEAAAGAAAKAAGAAENDLLSEEDRFLSSLHADLSVSALDAELAKRLGRPAPVSLWWPEIAQDVLAAAKTRIMHPVAYIAGCVAREPYRWGMTGPAPKAPTPATVTDTKARLIDCERGKHNWKYLTSSDDQSWADRWCPVCLAEEHHVRHINQPPAADALLNLSPSHTINN